MVRKKRGGRRGLVKDAKVQTLLFTRTKNQHKFESNCKSKHHEVLDKLINLIDPYAGVSN